MAQVILKAGNNKGFGRAALILITLSLTAIITYAVYMLFFTPEPEVTGTEGFKVLSADNNLTIRSRHLKEIEISVYQDGKTTELLKDVPEMESREYSLNIRPGKLRLSDGRAIVVIKAKGGIFKKVRYEIESLIDTTPPTLAVMRSPSILNTGSTGFAILKAGDAESVYLKLGERTFKAFEVRQSADTETGTTPGYGIEPYIPGENRKRRSAGIYYVFFPAPFDSVEDEVFYAIAEDSAGNSNIKTLSTRLNKKTARTSSIDISDSFIKTVISPLLNEMDISDPEGAFKRVNEDMRRQSLERIIDIAGRSGREILWSGRFLQLRNSKVMARYGDMRTYFYKGKEISSSVHLGYDLASFAGAPVTAANTGIIAYAGDLSIYGHTVIIDHGMGLMSLYGHLSGITVHEGQTVNKGDIIGKTGSSGLAGGDHLHFSILVHGYEVSPLYWWDPSWIKVNITDYLR